MDGFQLGPKDKLGIRGSDTHSLMFTDVKVPKENRMERMALVLSSQ